MKDAQMATCLRASNLKSQTSTMSEWKYYGLLTDCLFFFSICGATTILALDYVYGVRDTCM